MRIPTCQPQQVKSMSSIQVQDVQVLNKIQELMNLELPKIPTFHRPTTASPP